MLIENGNFKQPLETLQFCVGLHLLSWYLWCIKIAKKHWRQIERFASIYITQWRVDYFCIEESSWTIQFIFTGLAVHHFQVSYM